MIEEISAKVLLQRVRQPDPWFGLKYNMNLYRGCQHQCIYCDSRSECYQIEDFSNIFVKANAPELLRKELASKRIKGTIGTGSMNDPYMPLEKSRRLTRQALEIIREFRFPIHVITKSNLVLRDLDLLTKIGEVYAAVTMTITCADDALGTKLEPGAPLVSDRFKAIDELSSHGVLAGVTMMPVLPFIEDNADNIRGIVQRAAASGAQYIIPSFGMSLRDRQRTYYYEKLDEYFPGVRDKYEKKFGHEYHAQANSAHQLGQIFREECDRNSIAIKMPVYSRANARQLPLM
jgi:DNA repair photolyase